MKSKEKLEYITTLIEKLNKAILKNKNWKLQFINKGANNYCISIVEDTRELYSSSFGTYDNVMQCLDLIKSMFSLEINERKNKS